MLKSNKKIIILVLAILVTVTLSTSYSTPADAYIHYQILNIDDQQQETDSWCWAACVQMICYYFGSYPSQSQIVTLVRGWPDPDYGGTRENMQYTLGCYNIKSTINSSGSLSFGSVISYINSGKPIISLSSYHSRVVRGFYEDTSNSIQDIYYIDPLFSNGYFVLAYSQYNWTQGSLYNIYV